MTEYQRFSLGTLNRLKTKVHRKHRINPTLRKSDLSRAKQEFFGRAHHELGISIYTLAKIYGFDRDTIRYYIRGWKP